MRLPTRPAASLALLFAVAPLFSGAAHADSPNDPLFSSQYHVNNTGSSTNGVPNDINVQNWWNFAGVTRLGAGVTIAVVDDGLEHTHEDLSANYNAGLSYDFVGGDSNPLPGASDFHGTSVAGLAAGRGNNGTGVTGVAPRASLSGIRLLGNNQTDSTEAQALTYRMNTGAGYTGRNDIYSNSWGPDDGGTTLQGPGSLTAAAFVNGVTNGRGGRGSIYTWAAGNGGDGDNSNFDGYANNRRVIAVGATLRTGLRSPYSERGANLFINTPGGSSAGDIVTTDRTGSTGYSANNYATDFNGTSAATPIASGVVALMLEANPNLGWRDVKHILARTSTKNDPTNSSWSTNSAGFRHSELYGFGRADATAAATMAQTWTNVGPEISTNGSRTISGGLAIPDGTGSGTAGVAGTAVSDTINITTQMILETVELSVNISHTYRGDLGLVLTSPTGTQSTMSTYRAGDGAANFVWTMSTVRDWGELSAGVWTLTLRDYFAADTGRLNNWSLNLFGTAVPEPTAMLVLGGLGFGLLLRRRQA